MGNKALLLSVGFVVVFMLVSIQAQAGPPPPPPPYSGPIDGGAFALLLAAGVYGYRRLNAKEETPVNISK